MTSRMCPYYGKYCNLDHMWHHSLSLAKISLNTELQLFIWCPSLVIFVFPILGDISVPNDVIAMPFPLEICGNRHHHCNPHLIIDPKVRFHLINPPPSKVTRIWPNLGGFLVPCDLRIGGKLLKISQFGVDLWIPRAENSPGTKF